MDKLEEIYGIKIDNPDFFKRALTHPSYTKERDIPYTENYERMESRLKTDNASHDKITKQYEDAQAKL